MKLLIVTSVCCRMFFISLFCNLPCQNKTWQLAILTCYSCLLYSSSAFVASCLFGQGGMEILKLIFCTSTCVFFPVSLYSAVFGSLPCKISALSCHAMTCSAAYSYWYIITTTYLQETTPEEP